MTRTRRDFLRQAGAGALTTAGIGGLGASLFSFPARAADTNGYKALVCVFFFGGLDNHDTLLPFDQSSYDRYAEIRAPLLGFYDGLPGGSTRARDRLLPLSPLNSGAFGSRQFALTEEMTGLHGLFESGEAAIVANVGPLIRPLTRADFEAETTPTPARLFSHNDQQSTWVALAPEGQGLGWGGRFVDAALGGVVSPSDPFSAINTFGDGQFLTGEQARPFKISTNGAAEIELLRRFEGDANALDAFRAHFAAANFAGAHLIERDMANALGAALATNEAYNAALAGAPPVTTAFPPNFLGAQLRAVAETIAARNVLLAPRQVFFVGIGGFDSHSNQANDVPALQTEISTAIVAFHAAMVELGLTQEVTLFTASDFGRTLAINGDGTDHGWGAHHFVVGGGVEGRTIYGDPAPYDFEHDQDAGGGRLIPTTSIEQMAAPLGRWFGLTEPELASVFPNLANFTGGGPVFA